MADDGKATARLVDRVFHLVGLPLQATLLGALFAYRMLVSPLLPARCKFYPSCSAYGVKALRVHGCVKGLLLVAGRVFRCHPWQLGGINPVPPAGSWRAAVDLSGGPISGDNQPDTSDLVGV